MKNTEIIETSNTEMVTISRSEYEKFQAQGERISELEKHVDILMDALRLASISALALPPKRAVRRSWSS